MRCNLYLVCIDLDKKKIPRFGQNPGTIIIGLGKKNKNLCLAIGIKPIAVGHIYFSFKNVLQINF
jgi:hypothetical protein